MALIHLFIKTIIVLYVVFVVSASSDPYKLLGVSRRASVQEIRQSYKKLAKEWHPDKNKNEDAEQKFVEIKQAYEVLSDPNRRHMYDQYGITNEDAYQLKPPHDYSYYSRHASDSFEEFFGQNFYFDHDISLYHKLSITTKYFEQNVIPKSYKVPHVLLFYNDWCFRCTRLVVAFKKVIDSLEPLGVQFATVNGIHEEHLVRKTGIKEVPSIVLVINGHSYVLRDTLCTSLRIMEFIRKKLPYGIMTKIDDRNVDLFLRGWTDNKVRTLILEPRNQPKAGYLISAFYFHSTVTFGFVAINENSKEIQRRFQVHPNLDTLLIFNEDCERPSASISMIDIPTQSFHNVISKNRYLTLPRLSSQQMLEDICPAEWNRPRKRLCVILVTENIESHNFAHGALRLIALQNNYNNNRVRFAYIFKEKQSDFIHAISRGSTEESPSQIVVIWRRDSSHVKYEWIRGINLDIDNTSEELKQHVLNLTKKKIDSTIHRLLKTSEALSYEAFVQNLLDEHSQSLISKSITQLSSIGEYILENIEHEHILALVSLLGTIGFMFGVGYIMVHYVREEEANLKANGNIPTNSNNQINAYVPELRLYELRAEKYNGMVRLLKPGCRTLILITDLKSRSKLIPPFHKAVWPYRKSKTLMFGHMLIEKGLSWYSELLRLSLYECKSLQINPRNCVGTVLALNGHRRYFCMYHAKHPESTSAAKRITKMAKHDDVETGNFLDDFNSEDSDCDPKILLEENLLDGLSNWLDRLFEGMTHRYYINYWPDFPTK